MGGINVKITEIFQRNGDGTFNNLKAEDGIVECYNHVLTIRF